MIGLICRMDCTGLGVQTRNMAKFLKPDKIMLIDSTPFNGNEQHPEWYEGYNVQNVVGFPTIEDIGTFLEGLDKIFTCETFYNFHFVTYANQQLVKSFVQYNYEFLDYMVNNRLPAPSVFVAPSHWHTDDVRRVFGNDRVVYLPPPLYDADYADNRKKNMNRKGKRRFLHIIGKAAVHDRNGTNMLLRSLFYTQADFELVIKSQYPFVANTGDKRITVEISNPTSNEELYNDFDALILPRRYGGLCLPMNEALMSGMPVLMPHISPNTMILPRKWQIQAGKAATFRPRTLVDIYNANHKAIATKLTELSNMSDDDLKKEKLEAYEIAKREYSADTLKPKYKELLCEQ